MNFISELREGLGISWRAIRVNKLRSVLTTLGIVIGILTVTLMGTAIEGVNRSFVNSLSFIGADTLYVQKSDWGDHSYAQWLAMQKRRELTLEQAEAIGKQVSLARAVAPADFTRLSVQYEKQSAGGVTIIGSTDQMLLTSSITLADGRFMTAAESDGGRPVCVIGSELATNLFKKEGALGKRIKIAQRQFEVIGVLQKQGSMFGDFDNRAIVPMLQYTSAFVHTHDVDQIQVKVSNASDLENAREELRTIVRRLRHLAPSDPDDFAINQQDQILKMLNRVTGTMASVGLFITGLSLFVGGIGIMNIMFASVAERTREIGILKALGARRRTILVQFLIEAATICLIGGSIGLGIAWPLTLLVQRFMPAAMSPLIVGVSLLTSLLVGVVSGLLPAWRAARMNPVDALRNE